MMKLRIEDIKPAAKPARSKWDEMALDELTRSIQKEGVIVPIKVRPAEGGKYEIVYGHRRLEAARRADLNEIEAIVEGLDNDRRDIQALVENEVRQEMSLMDRARAYKRLHDDFGLTWEEIGTSIGKRGHYVKTIVAYLDEPPELTRYLEAAPAKRGEKRPHELGHWQVQEITRALGDDDEAKIAVAEKVTREGLGGHQTIEVARTIAAIKDREVRQRLLEQEYTPMWGKWEKEVVEEERERKKSAVEWALYPTASSILGWIKKWDRELIPNWQRSIELGKLSSEAIRFLANRLRRFAERIAGWADEIESAAQKED